MTILDEDILSLMNKRVIDLVNIMGGKVKIFLNNKYVEIKRLIKYLNLIKVF